MKKLLIVESPAKIKTISKFLGKDFKIMSTIGHVKDLPPKKLGVTINDKAIDIDYEVIENKDKVIADICKEAAKSDEIYLAPDPDREGEIIAWHIGQEIEKVAKKSSHMYRIWFNEITKNAVTNALEHPSHIDMQKVAAQQARRVLDRWVGYEVSPILWRKITKGLSAGRVQSVALRLICDREDEIRAFKPEEYWSIEATFKHKDGDIIAPLTHINDKKIDIKTEKVAKETVKKIESGDYSIESIEDKERSKKASPPFMTSTLQQAAYNQLGFAVKKTMQLAQNLYEGIPLEDAQSPVALITYMRSDSLRIAESAVTEARSFIKKQYGADYLPSKANVYAKAGKAQDAHEAIRPIDVSVTPEMVKRHASPELAKLYELIWKRFVSCQMTPALYAQRQVTITGDKFTFKVTGSTLIFDGFTKVYSASDDEDGDEKKVVLPKHIKEKDALDLTKTDPKQHFTQPPARYSEASLVKALEKEGIGRPSTYATILNTIRARSYTTVEKKRFMPTELGMTVTKLLIEHLPRIMDLKFTAAMEEQLDRIAQGELERDKLLRGFYKEFQDDLKKFIGPKKEQGKKHIEPTEITCPKCKDHKLAIRMSRNGPFLGCMGYPECTFTSNFKRAEDGTIELIKTPEPILLDRICPKCKKHKLRQMVGRAGSFISCSGYPECKYIEQTKASFPCPLDKGAVVKKLWKGSVFWGCANYPTCKFVVFGDIEETPCPQCGLPFLVKKYTKKEGSLLVCSNKACGYKKVVAPPDEEN
ncbi:MAG: type I DNA topoisomerase [Candidatus Babeliales bacterium]